MNYEDILEDIDCPHCGSTGFEPLSSYDVVCSCCGEEYEIFELLDD